MAARNPFVSEAERPPEQKAGRGRSRSTAGRNLLKEHEEAVALVEGVPFTNSQAELVKQKVSRCFRTNQGAAVTKLYRNKGRLGSA